MGMISAARRSGVLAACLLLPAAALAGVKEDYQALFGQDDARVSATVSTQDDAEFAAKLLKLTQALGDTPALQAYLWEKAYEFGTRDATGHATALAALEHLEKAVPDKAAQWSAMRLKAYRLRYAASRGDDRVAAAKPLLDLLMKFADADYAAGRLEEARDQYQQALLLAGFVKSPQAEAIREAIRRIVARQEDERKLEKLRQAVAGAPGDLKARMALIEHLVLERDLPDEAAKHLNQDVDEATRTYVRLAAKPPADVAPGAAWELAGWYRSLAANATSHGKVVALARARAYLTAFLRKHEQRDVARLKATLALQEVADELAKLGGAPAAAIGAVKIAFHDKAVQQAYEKALAYLKSQQHAEGFWPLSGASSYSVEMTSLAAFALLGSGASPRDPQIVKAADWIKDRATDRTRALAWRCRFSAGLAQGTAGEALRARKDVQHLLDSTTTGGFGYMSYGRPYDSFTAIDSYLVHAAIAAAGRGGLNVPKPFWQAAMKTWAGSAGADGGWSTSRGGSSSHAAATAAGVAGVLVCYEQVYGRKPVNLAADVACQPAKAGLAWLDKAFAESLKSRIDSRPWNSTYYDDFYGYLFLVSEGALAAGRKQIGGADWFKAGAAALLKYQDKDGRFAGRYGPERATAYAVLFLINGFRAGLAGG